MPKVILIKHKKDPKDLWVNVTVRIPPKMREEAAKLDLNQSAIARQAIGRAIRIELRNQRITQEMQPAESERIIQKDRTVLELQTSEKKEEVDQPLPCKVNHSYGCATDEKHTDNEVAPGDSPDREVAT
jgi:hypothetical protein